MQHRTLTFADFELDLETLELRQAGTLISIQRKPLEVLAHLLRHPARIVSKDELLRRVWPDVSVSEDALTSALRDLRRGLGDTNSPHRVIVTVRGQGYRFLGSAAEGERFAGSHPALDARRSRPENTFVDRGEVMLELEASLHAALRGERRVSLLAGPAGIGKTRTALELVGLARQLGVDVHLARCYGGDGAMPFWPWLQIVRSALGGKDLGAFAARERNLVGPLAWIAPELAETGSVEPRRDIHLLDVRFQLFGALTALVRKLCQDKPRLMFIDDLHWGDDASLLLLEFLSQNLLDARLHLVAAFRDGDVGQEHTLRRVLGAIAGHRGSERIDLVGLRSDSVAQILALAAGREPARGFAEKVQRATAGNPFFVSEIARLVASGQLNATLENAEVPVPARVRDAVRLHLKQRSSACEDLLKLASVTGRQIELFLLTAAFEKSQRHTLELLDEAESAGLLRRVSSEPPCYDFVHDLVRETLYRDLTRVERVSLHRKVATALESLRDPDRLEELAYHYAEAAEEGVADKALFYSQRAAEKAVSLMACEDAVAHYNRALTALRLLEGSDPELSCELILAQAEAAWGTLEQAEAVQQRFVRAANSARAIGSGTLLARAALGRTGYGAGPGDFRDISSIDLLDIELLTEASGALGNQPSKLKALVLSRLGLAVIRQQPPLAMELTAEAQKMAERLADPETLAWVLRYRHEVISGPDFVHERLVLAERLLRLARQVGCRPLELDALHFAARDHFELADLAPASHAAMAAAALSATMRHPGAHFRAAVSGVLYLTMRGEFVLALRAAQDCFERHSVRNLSAHGTFSVQRAMIYTLSGRYEDVLRELRVEGRVWAFNRYWEAGARAALGRAEEARREFELAACDSFSGVPRDHTFLASLMMLADLSFYLDDSERARQLYEIARPFEHMVAAPYISTLCLGAVSRGLGVLTHVLRQYAQSEQYFEQALGIERKLESPPLVLQTLARYARMLLARGQSGDRERASRILGEAAEICEKLGAALPVGLSPNSGGEVPKSCSPTRASLPS